MGIFADVQLLGTATTTHCTFPRFTVRFRCFSSCKMIFHMSLSLDWWGNLNVETVFSDVFCKYEGSWSKPKAQETFCFRGSQFWSRFLLVNFKKPHQSSISKSARFGTLCWFQSCFNMVQSFLKLISLMFSNFSASNSPPVAVQSPGAWTAGLSRPPAAWRWPILRGGLRGDGEHRLAAPSDTRRLENRCGGSFFRGGWAVEHPPKNDF